MYLILGLQVGGPVVRRKRRTTCAHCRHHQHQHVASSNTKFFGLLQDEDKKKLHTRFFIGLKKDSSIILYVVVYGSFFCIFCNKKKVLQQVLKKLFKELNHSQWWHLRNSVLFTLACKIWIQQFNRPLQMIFHGKKLAQIRQILMEKNSKLADFYDKFHY